MVPGRTQPKLCSVLPSTISPSTSMHLRMHLHRRQWVSNEKQSFANHTMTELITQKTLQILEEM